LGAGLGSSFGCSSWAVCHVLLSFPGIGLGFSASAFAYSKTLVLSLPGVGFTSATGSVFGNVLGTTVLLFVKVVMGLLGGACLLA